MVNTITNDAVECNQNGRQFFLSVISDEILEKVCFVSRRDEEPIKGFQRNLNSARARDIASYLDNIKGTIPSALILSAQPNAKFKFNKKTKQISFFEVAKSFMVLDGQHRLFGLFLTKNKYDVPVIIFNNLTTNDEVNLFVDINTNQKGVPTTLLLDIKNLTGRETKKEERQRLLFDRLNEDSVIAGLMSPTKSQTGKISRVSFNQSTKNVFDDGFFEDKDDLTIYMGVKNYLQAIEIVFKESKSVKAKITNTNLFRSIFSIFKRIIDKSLSDYGNIKVESLVRCMEPLTKLDYDSYTGTGNAAVSSIVMDMNRVLDNIDRLYRELNTNSIF